MLSQRIQALTHGKTQQQKGACVPQFPPKKHVIARLQFQGGQENVCKVLDPPAGLREHLVH